ncbi:MAG: bifunctional [glutamate--ammonia ligase]-adenylyl-L-tyrosine phosphorylase/[glutamate--ammonia-ligase] adenylyltransferase [Steroidobacteraceae bacterium]
MSQAELDLTLPAALAQAAAQQIAAARSASPEEWTAALGDPRLLGTLPFVWTMSEFIAMAIKRDAALLPALLKEDFLFRNVDRAAMAASLADALKDVATDNEVMRVLRLFRRRHMVRIAWRDLCGWAAVDEILADLSALADACIQAACDYASRSFSERHGQPRDESGVLQPLVILGMGKLGGGELNFSSDIDLVFLYPQGGETDGARPISNTEYFIKVGQRTIHLLANTTPDGFVYRVDMRLRPFGESGALASSFDSFEAYLQQHGRDWERYAYVKARVITGAAFEADLYRNLLRPFVYRRYLDFGVFESLRSMKEMIAREVERRDLQDNVKLGPGGIREIEFIVQAFQLIRGGSDPRLQSRQLLPTLKLLTGQKLLPQAAVDELAESYRFLRRVENRLQEWNDEQTHSLPTTPERQQRLALAMGHADWDALQGTLDLHRQRVSRHFDSIVFAPATGASESAAACEALLDSGRTTADREVELKRIGFAEPHGVLEQIDRLRESGYYRRLDDNGHRRLHVLLPKLLKSVVGGPHPEVTLGRLLKIVEMIGGRTVYLALLNENRIALERLIDLCARSQFLADQIAAFPLLLDELIDDRLYESLPSRQEFKADLTERMEGAWQEDAERQIELLRQFQRAALFRIAVADLSGHLPLMKVSDRLTDLAELILAQTFVISWAQVAARHGTPQCGPDEAHLRPAGMVAVAYGKLGGIELGYGSDLDLVFLHDSSGEVQRTDGKQSIDNSVFFARVAQKIVHLLTVHSAAGRLYEIDTRLRPSGKGGLLVQSLHGFGEYQRKEAWTWEHQALLRARAVAGGASLREEFERIRIDTLRTAVRRDTLQEEVRNMRARMRNELSRAKAGQVDLKQDAGGIADIEFLTQYWMLKWADRYPEIIYFSDNIRQLESLASGNLVPQSDVDFLTSTYRRYRERMHHLSLDEGGGIIDASEFVDERKRVIEMWKSVMGEG